MAQPKGERIRLLFISDHLGHPGGFVHGVTTYFLNVLPRLREEGVEVTACFLRARHPSAEKLEAGGVHPIFLNRRKWDLGALSDLRRLIRSRHIQIVHATGIKGILLGRLAAYLAGTPVIIHLHDMFTPGPFLGALHRSMAGWTDLCLVVSNAARGVAIKEFGIPADRVMTLYNGLAMSAVIPSEARDRIRREFDFSPTTPLIGIVGRFTPEKGQLPFLQSFPQLRATHPQACALLIGDGPIRPACEKLSKSLGLNQAVRFAGHRDDVPELLAAIDILAIPSRSEGLPYCAIEAMMAALPIVAFRVGGIPELITDGETGLLASPADLREFLDALRRLLDDPDWGRRLGRRARIQAEKFSLENHVQELLSRYRQLTHLSESCVVGDVATNSR